MIQGIELKSGVTTIVVAPLNLRLQFEEPTKSDVDRVRKGIDDDVASFEVSAVNVLLACARRNHPELTREQLLDAIDAADLFPLLIAVLNKSGFEPRPLGPTLATASQAVTANPSLAPASSDSSSTQQDGSPTTSSTA